MAVYGISGFLTFRGHTQGKEQEDFFSFIILHCVLGDILNNFCWDDDLMTVCRFMFTITVLLTYPIELFVVREVLVNLIYEVLGKLSVEVRTNIKPK